MKPITVVAYRTRDGVVPFNKWLRRLGHELVLFRINHRLEQLKAGNADDCKFVGGDKSTQQKDIKLAQSYWLDWQDSERTQ